MFHYLIPIKIKKSDEHFAHNNIFGIEITTGCRYFAAILAQEVHQCTRFMLQTWGGLVIALTIAALSYASFPYVALAAAAIYLVMILAPFKRIYGQIELEGQAVELAVDELIYGRKNMDDEFWRQARSLVRDDSPYMKEGLFPAEAKIPFGGMEYGEANPRVEAMLVRLHKAYPGAKRWVEKRRHHIEKWVALGEGDQGY